MRSDYSVVEYRVKDICYYAFGSHMFREAKSAAEKKQQRCGRRAKDHKHNQIRDVKEIILPDISKVDPYYYARQAESGYVKEDKKQYPDPIAPKPSPWPTIYHLYQELINNPAPHDPREVYDAILCLFKHKGHFLNPVLDGSGVCDIAQTFADLAEKLFELYSVSVPQDAAVEALIRILPDRKLKLAEKKKAILEACDLKKDKSPFQHIVALMCGSSVVLQKVFPDEPELQGCDKISLSFREIQCEEKLEEAADVLSPDAMEVLDLIKQIYDWGVLSDILTVNGKQYELLCDARVAAYEKHKMDLELLKALYRKYAPDLYEDMFWGDCNDGYVAYTRSNMKGRFRSEKCKTMEDRNQLFFSRVKRDVSDMPECPERAQVLEALERDDFLQKQMTSKNCVIPYQLQMTILEKILCNAENYMPSLAAVDAESGLTGKERIIALFKFHMPYYIGPLAGEYSWCVRKEPGKIYPWNLEEKIDVPATAHNFIMNMVGTCTCLGDEKVLPKNALIYEAYAVLNELNAVRVDGDLLPKEVKQGVYRDLFLNGQNVTAKRLRDYLAGHMDGYRDDMTVSGISGSFNNRLSSYAKFARLYGVDVLSKQQWEMSEQIIFWSAVYGGAPELLAKMVREAYGKDAGGPLSEEDIRKVTMFRFQKWGKLSQELLFLPGRVAGKKGSGNMPLIKRMWEENITLMQALSSKYTYNEEVMARTPKMDVPFEELTFEDIKKLTTSRAARRMVWRTIRVVRDVVQKMGGLPRRIFIEAPKGSTNGASKKGKKPKTRKEILVGLYEKSSYPDKAAWIERVKDCEDLALQDNKVYLYFLQHGTDIYTGEPIEYDDLHGSGKWTTDHIYPKHFVTDNSIDNNLVLTSAYYNEHVKKDVVPIREDTQEAMKAFWESLYNMGFITAEKLYRLTRKQPFSDDELVGFAAQALTTAHWGAKLIKKVLQDSLGGRVEVVCVNHEAVKDFRTQFDLPENKLVNNDHYAKNAYLCAVVGNVHLTKFTSNPLPFIMAYRKDPKKNAYHMGRLYDFDIQREGYMPWIAGPDGSIRAVREVMALNCAQEVYMSYEAENAMIANNAASSAKKAAAGIGYIPLKGNDSRKCDITKYGGYTSCTTSYFFIVEHTGKDGKRLTWVEDVSTIKQLQYGLDTEESLLEYCKNVLGFKDPVIRLKKLEMGTLVKYNGYPMVITGRSRDRITCANAVKLILSTEHGSYLKKLHYRYEAYSKRCKSKKGPAPEPTDRELAGIDKAMNIEIYDVLMRKLQESIYRLYKGAFASYVVEGRERFTRLPLMDQAYTLLQIVKLMSTPGKSVTGDLRKIGGKESSGSLYFKKDITNASFVTIFQSPAGLHKRLVGLEPCKFTGFRSCSRRR